ncbi:hypothetical protein BDV12DRAFT_198570 [Aspergillus spectabilis]
MTIFAIHIRIMVQGTHSRVWSLFRNFVSLDCCWVSCLVRRFCSWKLDVVERQYLQILRHKEDHLRQSGTTPTIRTTHKNSRPQKQLPPIHPHHPPPPNRANPSTPPSTPLHPASNILSVIDNQAKFTTLYDNIRALTPVQRKLETFLWGEGDCLSMDGGVFGILGRLTIPVIWPSRRFLVDSMYSLSGGVKRRVKGFERRELLVREGA